MDAQKKKQKEGSQNTMEEMEGKDEENGENNGEQWVIIGKEMEENDDEQWEMVQKKEQELKEDSQNETEEMEGNDELGIKDDRQSVARVEEMDTNEKNQKEDSLNEMEEMGGNDHEKSVIIDKKEMNNLIINRMIEIIIQRMDYLGQNLNLHDFKLFRDLQTIIDTEIMNHLTEIAIIIDGNEEDCNFIDGNYSIVFEFIQKAFELTERHTRQWFNQTLTNYFENQANLLEVQISRSFGQQNDGCKQNLDLTLVDLTPVQIDRAVFAIQSPFIKNLQMDIFPQIKLIMEQEFDNQKIKNAEINEVLFKLLNSLTIIRGVSVLSTPSLILDTNQIGARTMIDTEGFKGLFSGQKKLIRLQKQNKQCMIFIPAMHIKNNNSIGVQGLCEVYN